MIPYGLNPFGLEDKTLTFHVMVNDIETDRMEKKNRMYCWAEFPEKYRGWGYLQWAAPADNNPATSQEAYDALTKYVTRNPGATSYLGVNQFMVLGDQHFYYQTFEESSEPDPGGDPSTYKVIFDSRIYDTYWPESGRSSYLDVPTYSRAYGQQIGTLPEVVAGNTSFGWPTAQMETIRSGESISTNNQYTSTLLGWYDQKIGGTQVQPTDTVTGSKTYYAKWEWTYTHGNIQMNAQTAAGNMKNYFGYIPGSGKFRLTVQNLYIYHDGSPSGHALCWYLYYNNPKISGARTPMGNSECINSSGQLITSPYWNIQITDPRITKVDGGGSCGIGYTNTALSGKTFVNVPYFYVLTTGKTGITVNFECEFTLPECLPGDLYFNLGVWSFQQTFGQGNCDNPNNYYFCRSGDWTLTML